MIARLLAVLALLASLLAVPAPASAVGLERITIRRPAVEQPLPTGIRHKHLPANIRRR